LQFYDEKPIVYRTIERRNAYFNVSPPRFLLLVRNAGAFERGHAGMAGRRGLDDAGR
jgi:hypothetical protein